MKLTHLIASAALLGGVSLTAQAPAPLAALSRMPIKEVTIFKDGHAFVLHEGALPTDPAGNIVMDYLPAPVLGTFWPYVSTADARLTGVVAGQRRVLVEQTALTLAELIDGNAGAEAVVTEKAAGPNREPVRYSCTIVGVPVRSSDELAQTGLPGAPPRTPERGNVVLLRTADGVRVVPVDNIQDVTFKTPPRARLSHEEFRNLLTLRLDWGGRRAAPLVPAGLVYLQKGLRWIPEYKVTIDGAGHAAVTLQATLLDELADLEDVTANLVIGVPSFAFKDTIDPMALQQSVAQLSSYFQSGDRMSSLSNAIASQAASARSASPAPEADAPGLGPALPESAKSEDLFVFTVRHLSMKKGERLLSPVAESTLAYTDVFTLDLPFGPPREVRSNLDTERQTEMARLLGAPAVAHKVRLTNSSAYPLTTAPALVMRDGRVLAQGLMTYTAVGATSDLEITKAVDIQAAKADAETARVPNAVRWQGSDYARIDLTGTITMTNRRDNAVDVEVTRHVLGNLTAATNGGLVTQVNTFEEGSSIGDLPAWWRWYSWPDWWAHFNGVGRITWKVRIEPGKSVDLGYTWHYFWR